MTLPGLWAAQVSQLDPFFIIVTIPLFRDCPSLILEKWIALAGFFCSNFSFYDFQPISGRKVHPMQIRPELRLWHLLFCVDVVIAGQSRKAWHIGDHDLNKYKVCIPWSASNKSTRRSLFISRIYSRAIDASAAKACSMVSAYSLSRSSRRLLILKALPYGK